MDFIYGFGGLADGSLTLTVLPGVIDCNIFKDTMIFNFVPHFVLM